MSVKRRAGKTRSQEARPDQQSKLQRRQMNQNNQKGCTISKQKFAREEMRSTQNNIKDAPEYQITNKNHRGHKSFCII